ncbi:PREDICTED: valencene synthase-like isoform X2 [Populus euphratica]|uniref:Isoprene synthase, chloroplastic n=1 Tax=Populus euphratica TaxID=75702 RepID=A0AAJ6X4P1_POPEU|nr:PREDICTED: valencene synthase-like isoform X1 [Populus euphratica]XP_011005623.1 PREDICTED: valencene synthase-like isoform X2 [Populus euphratica]
MSTQVSQEVVPKTPEAHHNEIIRRTANFHPSIWGDQFISHLPKDKVHEAIELQEIEKLREQFTRELLASNSSQQLDLIDAIQRLGVAYHFETEIEEALQHIYNNRIGMEDDDLYNTALGFRLLRQHGYNVSCDIFNKFKDDKGYFKQSNDVRGILGLYEAAHLAVHGEDILDEALALTTIHLKSMATSPDCPLAAKVSHALKQPIRRGVPRLESRRYISIYQDEPSCNKTLLRLGKLNFNLVQELHKEELAEITRWWKGLDFARRLPFARDRVVECFFWIVGVYFEPQYSLARKILTKVIAMTSIIDDIYDVYGTLEELELFTAAIDRWDTKSMDHLPDYMKICYEALLNVYSEMEEKVAKEGWSYRVHYGKEAMKVLVHAYFNEAKWFHENHIPTMEEYMQVALVTTGYCMLATVSFVGMGDMVTEQAFDWVFNHPKIIRASETIARLMDDVKSHKFEQERGHAASGVECYIRQYGLSEQEVYEEFHMQVVNAWKDINEECLKPTAVPMPLLERILNLSRVMDVIYKEEDGYTHVGKVMKNNVASLLIDSVPI